jgi:hypothetical protein
MQSLNCKETDSFDNLYIPSNLTTMMSTMAQRLVNIDGIKNKMDQLISLVVLYNHITSEQQKFSVSFTPIQKRNFFKEASSDITFYTLHFSKTLVIHIGHNLKRDQDGDPAYIDNNDEFKFFSFVHLKDLRNSDYKEYLTNDIDYVYNALLAELRTIVNNAIGKDDELISFKDLEVYKMVQI